MKRKIVSLIAGSAVAANLLVGAVLADSYQSVEIQTGSDAITDCLNIDGKAAITSTIALGTTSAGGSNYTGTEVFCVVQITEGDMTSTSFTLQGTEDFAESDGGSLTFPISFVQYSISDQVDTVYGNGETVSATSGTDFLSDFGAVNVDTISADTNGSWYYTLGMQVNGLTPAYQRVGTYTMLLDTNYS